MTTYVVYIEACNPATLDLLDEHLRGTNCWDADDVVQA